LAAEGETGLRRPNPKQVLSATGEPHRDREESGPRARDRQGKRAVPQSRAEAGLNVWRPVAGREVAPSSADTSHGKRPVLQVEHPLPPAHSLRRSPLAACRRATTNSDSEPRGGSRSRGCPGPASRAVDADTSTQCVSVFGRPRHVGGASNRQLRRSRTGLSWTALQAFPSVHFGPDRYAPRRSPPHAYHRPPLDG
jgi:hypothetical protein